MADFTSMHGRMESLYSASEHLWGFCNIGDISKYSLDV